MGERVKDVYVTWEICEKEVYVMMDVMMDMKNVYVMGERGTYHEPPAPETRFLPHTPFAGKPETGFYLKPTNSLIINSLFKLLIINVLL